MNTFVFDAGQNSTLVMTWHNGFITVSHQLPPDHMTLFLAFLLMLAIGAFGGYIIGRMTRKKRADPLAP